MATCNACGFSAYIINPLKCPTPGCDATLEPGEDAAPIAATFDPVPPEDWPRWARWAAERREPGDIGVGSTLERLFARLGGEAFKRTAKAWGVPCGCAERRDQYDQQYRYS